MTDRTRQQLNEYSNIIQTILLAIIVPLMGWSLYNASDHSARLAVIEYESSIGLRYTGEMAKKDFGGVIERLDDHEMRIRSIEKRK